VGLYGKNVLKMKLDGHQGAIGALAAEAALFDVDPFDGM